MSEAQDQAGVSRRRILRIGAGAAGALAVAATEHQQNASAMPRPVPGGGPLGSLDLDAVMRGMRAELDGHCVGWTVAASAGGSVASAAGGLRRTAADAPAAAASAAARVNVAAATRAVTAVAVLQALAEQELSVTSRIQSYLPPDWARGPGIATLTFRDLLIHRSGFRGNAESYAQLRAAVAAGTSPRDKSFAYDHTNFALFRVLVPFLAGYDGAGDRDAATSARFLAHLNDRIFRPLGIAAVGASPAGGAPSLAYPHPARQTRGVTFGDWTRRAGSRGLHLSMTELAAFSAGLRTSERLLPAAQRDELFAAKFGWSPDNYPVSPGTLAFSGGDLSAATPGGSAVQNTYLCSFSSGLSIAVTTHSVNDDGMGLYLKAIRAHHDGWNQP